MDHLERPEDGITLERTLRVSAGAIAFHEDRVLLVSYDDSPDGRYFVGPGGGVLDGERIDQAVVREVREETALEVDPARILIVEDLLTSQQRTIKVWFLCHLTGGELRDTREAREEGITGVGWYSRDDLRDRTVYPSPILGHNWSDFFRADWQTEYIESRMDG